MRLREDIRDTLDRVRTHVVHCQQRCDPLFVEVKHERFDIVVEFCGGQQDLFITLEHLQQLREMTGCIDARVEIDIFDRKDLPRIRLTDVFLA